MCQIEMFTDSLIGELTVWVLVVSAIVVEADTSLYFVGSDLYNPKQII